MPIVDVKVPHWAQTKQARSFAFASLGEEGVGDPIVLHPTDDPGEDAWVEGGLGQLCLVPNCMRPNFWFDTAYGVDWYTDAEIRRPDQWTEWRHETYKTSIDATTLQTNGLLHDTIVPTYTPLDDWPADKAPEVGWVWETVQPIQVNEGISIRFMTYGVRLDAVNVVVAIGLRDFVFALRSNNALFVYRRTEAGEWRLVSTLQHSSTPLSNGEVYTLTILPMHKDAFVFYLSQVTLNLRPITGHTTGVPAFAPRVFHLSKSYGTPVEPTYSAVNNQWIKHVGGHVVLGITKENYAYTLGMSRVRYPDFSIVFLAPEPVVHFANERTLPPELEIHGFRNGLPGVISGNPCGSTGAAADETTDPLGVRLRLESSNSNIWTPEIAAVTLKWPAEFLTPDDATEDLSDKWTLIRLTRSTKFDAPDSSAFKLTHGRLVDNAFRLRQLPRSYSVKILNNDLVTYTTVHMGYLDSPRRFSLMVGAGLFEQSDGNSSIVRAFEREIGPFSAINGMDVGTFLRLVLNTMGYPDSRIVIDGVVGSIGNSDLPEDWFELIEDQRCSITMKSLLGIFGDLVRVIEKYDASGPYVHIYRKPTYGGTPSHIFTDVDYRLGSGNARLYYNRCQLATPVWKIASLPEIENHGAEMHRLLMQGATGTGAGAERVKAIGSVASHVYDDATHEDFEGQYRSKVIGPSRHPLAATEGAVYNIARNEFDSGSLPKRWLKIEGEWHPRIEIDQFVQVHLAMGSGYETDMGVYRIDESDLTIEHDAARAFDTDDRERWRASYLLESV